MEQQSYDFHLQPHSSVVLFVDVMEKNSGRGCVCGNVHGIVENGYNGVITQIADRCRVIFEKKNHIGDVLNL